jgi:hypothetical protein
VDGILATNSAASFLLWKQRSPRATFPPAMSHSLSASTNEGLKSEALRVALHAALAGKPAALEDLMCRYGGGNDARPNLRLAAAFGAEMAALPGTVVRLLSRLGTDDAAPDTSQVFLPIAAAYGWVGRLRAGLDVDQAWPALAELPADERVPVRLGTLDALRSFALREGCGDALVARALGWLDDEDRGRCFGTAALVVEVFANRQVLSALGALPPLLDYLTRAIATVAGASRSAERSDNWRRLLLSLPPTLAAVVGGVDGDKRGAAWLEVECTEARHPDVREALSTAILQSRTHKGQSAAVTARLRAALEGSAKPARDPTRKRPGTDRGKASRRMK